MANIKISQLTALSTVADTTVFSTVDSGTNYKLTGTVLKTYVRNSFSLATPATANLGGALNYVPSTGVFTFTPADKTNLVNNGKTLQLGTDGNLTAPGNLMVQDGRVSLNQGGNAYIESVDYGVDSANSAVNIFGGTYQKIKLRAGFGGTEKFWTFGTDGSLTLPSAGKIVNNNKEWLFNDTDGTLSSKMFLANAGSYGTTGYSFTGDGGLDTGMFSAGDGQIQFYSNTVKVAEIASGNLTISGHPTIEGVTSTGATGTGKLVFDNAPTFSGTVTTSTLTVKDVRDTVYAATFASTFTPDAANGAIQNVTLTGGITINAFANPVAGQTITLILTQGGSGSYTLTSSMKFAGGLKTLSTTVGSVDMLTITYTGSVYYASLVTGFV